MYTFEYSIIKMEKGDTKNNGFTKRENEILDLLINGKTSQQIAEAMFISKYTVDKHRGNMLRKTGAKNTAEMIIKVIMEKSKNIQ